jgi:heme-degrading monooxygenase HmoA
MIMTSIDFHLKPGKHSELKKVFEKYRIFDRAYEIKGCWKLAMIKPNESDDFVQVVGFWENESAYQEWLDNPERSLGTDDMLPLLNTDWDKSAPGQILEVLLSEPKSTGAWSKPA